MLEYMTCNKKMTFSFIMLSLLCLACANLNSVEAARGEDDGDSNDFDDSGFDDSGYNQPQNHDAESSHHSPQSSAEDDIDDDDEVDETQPKPVRSSTEQMGAYNNPNSKRIYNKNEWPSTMAHYQGRQDNQYAGEQPDAYDATNEPTQRYRRSLSASAIYDYLTSASNSATKTKLSANNQDLRPLLRVRRSKHIGPVYTYVKTDKSAHFKWGVKHKVGKSKHHG